MALLLRQLTRFVFASCLLWTVEGMAGPTGTEAEARAVLEAFLKPGANQIELSRALKPTTADYEFLLGDHDRALEVERGDAREWKRKPAIVATRPGQTLRLKRVTLPSTGAGSAGAIFYSFEFSDGGDGGRPGSSEVLAIINGHWVCFIVRA